MNESKIREIVNDGFPLDPSMWAPARVMGLVRQHRMILDLIQAKTSWKDEHPTETSETLWRVEKFAKAMQGELEADLKESMSSVGISS
jgi:hypothetical protein